LIEQLFRLGMKRELPQFKQWHNDGIVLNIGSGNDVIKGSVNLDLPEYNADVDPIPFDDGSVSTIHAYHVIEHLANPIFFIKECQRVLTVGGLINICVPHYKSEIAWHDLTHRRAVALDTFETLLKTEYYNTGNWELELIGSVAIGIVDRNLAILTQLEKIEL